MVKDKLVYNDFVYKLYVKILDNNVEKLIVLSVFRIFEIFWCVLGFIDRDIFINIYLKKIEKNWLK